MARPLRIAVWYNLPHGGARRSLYDHVKGLQERGHLVEVWRPANPTYRDGFADVSELVREHEVSLSEVPSPGHGRIENLVHLKEAMGRKVAAMVEHSEVCAQQIGAGGFDLFLAHQDVEFNAPFIGRAIKDIPKLLYLAEPYRPIYEAHPESVWSTYWPFRSLRHPIRWRLEVFRAHHRLEALRARMREETANAKAFDRVLVNSYYSRESTLKAYGPAGLDVRVCYLGINFERFKNRHLPRERFVMGLGEIGYRKNVEGAICAVATIKVDRPPLVWVGNRADENYHARVVQLANDLGVDLRIHLMASDEEVQDFLGRAGVMTYTSLLEPFGYAPLEANACGLAVAAVAEGGVRETIQHGVNGLLAEPSPESLGQAIETLLNHPEMGDSAERHVHQHWGLKMGIDTLERHLREVLNSYPSKG